MKTFLPEYDDLFAITLKMVKLGFRKRIIVMSLNTSETMIDSIRRDHDLKPDDKTGRMKIAETILADPAGRREATVFMIIYLYISADPENTLEIPEVITACEIYRELHIHFGCCGHTDRMLDANDVWVLARDYLQKNIINYNCKDCGQVYFSPVGYKGSCKKHFCPFCQSSVDKTLTS